MAFREKMQKYIDENADYIRIARAMRHTIYRNQGFFAMHQFEKNGSWNLELFKLFDRPPFAKMWQSVKSKSFKECNISCLF